MTTLTLPSDSIDDLLEEIPPGSLSEEAEQWARDICNALCEHHFASGRTPDGLAAGAIYAAALAKDDYHNGARITQEQVSEWCGVSVITIRNNYKRAVAAWAEVNEDDLDDRDRWIHSQHWGADIDVPDARPPDGVSNDVGRTRTADSARRTRDDTPWDWARLKQWLRSLRADTEHTEENQ